MQIKQLIILYVSILIVVAVLDLVWISVIAKNFYQLQSNGSMLEFSMIPAILFYLMYPAAIVYFITRCNHSVKELDWKTVAVDSAILGFTAYATYNLTNLATIRNWAVRMSVVDMMWGTFVTTVSGTLGVIIASQFI